MQETLNLNKMKQLVLILMLIPSALSAQYTGDTFAKANQTKQATWIFTISEAPGFAGTTPSGDLTGITADLMKGFAEYIERTKGINVVIKNETGNANNFPGFLASVKNSKGGVFGLSNTTITDERKSSYNFSPPYITNIGMILTHNSVPTVNSLDEISEKFKGMTAVTVKNSTNEARILDIKKKYFPNLEIKYVSSFLEAMDIIAEDPMAFTNVDFTYYFEAVKNRQPVKRHPGGDDPTEQFGIIMPKSNDWSPLLEEYMNETVGSTEYKKIILDNLGQSALKFFDTIK